MPKEDAGNAEPEDVNQLFQELQRQVACVQGQNTLEFQETVDSLASKEPELTVFKCLTCRHNFDFPSLRALLEHGESKKHLDDATDTTVLQSCEVFYCNQCNSHLADPETSVIHCDLVHKTHGARVWGFLIKVRLMNLAYQIGNKSVVERLNRKRASDNPGPVPGKSRKVAIPEATNEPSTSYQVDSNNDEADSSPNDQVQDDDQPVKQLLLQDADGKEVLLVVTDDEDNCDDPESEVMIDSQGHVVFFKPDKSIQEESHVTENNAVESHILDVYDNNDAISAGKKKQTARKRTGQHKGKRNPNPTSHNQESHISGDTGESGETEVKKPKSFVQFMQERKAKRRQLANSSKSMSLLPGNQSHKSNFYPQDQDLVDTDQTKETEQPRCLGFNQFTKGRRANQRQMKQSSNPYSLLHGNQSLEPKISVDSNQSDLGIDEDGEHSGNRANDSIFSKYLPAPSFGSNAKEAKYNKPQEQPIVSDSEDSDPSHLVIDEEDDPEWTSSLVTQSPVPKAIANPIIEALTNLFPRFDNGLVREQDLEKAKIVFEKAREAIGNCTNKEEKKTLVRSKNLAQERFRRANEHYYLKELQKQVPALRRSRNTGRRMVLLEGTELIHKLNQNMNTLGRIQVLIEKKNAILRNKLQREMESFDKFAKKASEKTTEGADYDTTEALQTPDKLEAGSDKENEEDHVTLNIKVEHNSEEWLLQEIDTNVQNGNEIVNLLISPRSVASKSSLSQDGSEESVLLLLESSDEDDEVSFKKDSKASELCA